METIWNSPNAFSHALFWGLSALDFYSYLLTLVSKYPNNRQGQ